MRSQKYLLAGLAIAMAVIAVVSLWVLGSPSATRERNQDRQRVADLRSIEGLVWNYILEHEQLPSTLDALRRGNQWMTIPTDPQTDDSYEYRRLNEERYELCATFTGEDRGPTEWAHGPGRQCFEMSAPKN